MISCLSLEFADKATRLNRSHASDFVPINSLLLKLFCLALQSRKGDSLNDTFLGYEIGDQHQCSGDHRGDDQRTILSLLIRHACFGNGLYYINLIESCPIRILTCSVIPAAGREAGIAIFVIVDSPFHRDDGVG